MTIGATLATRGSTAAVSHDVQPRFEAPATVNESTGICQRSCANAWTASIARTALLTIGSSSGQSESPPVQILIERVGDQRILATLEQRLERHLPQHRDGSPQRFREPRENSCLARQVYPGSHSRIRASSVRRG